MTVEAADAVRPYYGMRPEVAISIPDSALHEARVSRAFVAVYSSEDGWCPPGTPESDPGFDVQTLAGRHVYHSTWIEAAGSFGYKSETFSTLYRDKCFVIQTIVESPRVDYDENGEDIAGVERDTIYRHRDKVAASLMKVLRTVVFLDKSPTPPAARAAEYMNCEYGATSHLLVRAVCQERKREIRLAKRNPGILLMQSQANLDSVEQEIQRLDAQPVTADILKQLGDARNRLPAAQSDVRMARELEDVAAQERAAEKKKKYGEIGRPAA